MSNEFLREGGPLNIKKSGPDQYSMNVSIPPDTDGRIARACPNTECSPAYFKVKPGTGLTGQERAYCPYCRQEAQPSSFGTKEQLRYAKDMLMGEVHEGIDRMFRDALGVGSSGRKRLGGGFLSMDMTYKSAPKTVVRHPAEEQLKRDVICPGCGLDHSVFGLATWCADCGTDIFLTHVQTELGVVLKILGDVERRRELFGARVAAKDLENCLEDTVSIFEAVLRIIARRGLAAKATAPEEVDRLIKQQGNGFQNVERARQFFELHFDVQMFGGIPADDVEFLRATFEKRHPITHNLGVVDRWYLARTRAAEEEGREIVTTLSEIELAVSKCSELFATLYKSVGLKA